jgi:predicted HTH domain antitoxin
MPVKCEITLPDKILIALGLREEEIGDALKKELAVYFFQRNVLSFGQARQLSGLSVWDFLEFMKERKVPLHYGVYEYEEDLKTIKEFI